MKRLASLALVLTALLLVMLPVRASPDVYTDENFSSSGGLDGVEVVAGNVRLRVTPEHWTQTTKADFEQWESHENVTASPRYLHRTQNSFAAKWRPRRHQKRS
ncbi:unnamed protein product, partial [marine sediment metagenome]